MNEEIQKKILSILKSIKEQKTLSIDLANIEKKLDILIEIQKNQLIISEQMLEKLRLI